MTDVEDGELTDPEDAAAGDEADWLIFLTFAHSQSSIALGIFDPVFAGLQEKCSII